MEKEAIKKRIEIIKKKLTERKRRKQEGFVWARNMRHPWLSQGLYTYRILAILAYVWPFHSRFLRLILQELLHADSARFRVLSLVGGRGCQADQRHAREFLGWEKNTRNSTGHLTRSKNVDIDPGCCISCFCSGGRARRFLHKPQFDGSRVYCNRALDACYDRRCTTFFPRTPQVGNLRPLLKTDSWKKMKLLPAGNSHALSPRRESCKQMARFRRFWVKKPRHSGHLHYLHFWWKLEKASMEASTASTEASIASIEDFMEVVEASMKARKFPWKLL